MPKASDLLSIDDFYIADSIHDDNYFKERSVHEIAEGQCILEGVPTDEKLKEVNRFNKETKVRPPKITKGFKRPKLSDMDIALIQASYGTVPADTIAHLMGVPKKTVINTYKTTHKYSIPLMPLITVVDTSRYLEPEVERTVYNSDELNHLDDPRTYKELLRHNSREYKHDAEILKKYVSTAFTPTDIERTLSGLNTRLFLIENVKEIYFGIYGRTWSEDIKGIFRSGLSTRYLTPYISRYKAKRNKDKILYHFIPQPVKFNNELIKAFNLPTSTPPEILFQTSLILNATTNYVHQVGNKHVKIPNLTLPYTTDMTLASNYKPNKDGEYYLPYLVTRPKLYERALGSPLVDNRGMLRYAIYHAKPFKPAYFSDMYEDDTYYFGIRCRKCNTFLTPHTVQSCSHIKIKSVLQSKRIVPLKGTLKPVTLYLDRITDETTLKTIKEHFKTLDIVESPNKEIKRLQARSDIKTLDSSQSQSEFNGQLINTIKSKRRYLYGKGVTKTLPKKSYSFLPSNKFDYTFNTGKAQLLEVYIDDPVRSLHSFTLHYYKHSTKLKDLKPDTLGLYEISNYNVYELYTQFHTVLHSTLQEPQLKH